MHGPPESSGQRHKIVVVGNSAHDDEFWAPRRREDCEWSKKILNCPCCFFLKFIEGVLSPGAPFPFLRTSLLRFQRFQQFRILAVYPASEFVRPDNSFLSEAVKGIPRDAEDLHNLSRGENLFLAFGFFLFIVHIEKI